VKYTVKIEIPVIRTLYLEGTTDVEADSSDEAIAAVRARLDAGESPCDVTGGYLDDGDWCDEEVDEEADVIVSVEE
jgi:hypothetical protein